MKHIFVATDGSDMGAKAVDHAAKLAAKFDVPLTVGHVLKFDRSAKELARMAEVEHLVRHAQPVAADVTNVPDTLMRSFMDTEAGDEMVRLVTLIGDEILHRAVDRAGELGATRVTSKSSQGDTADEILDMAEAAGADMIVVGHRGLGRLKTTLMGSVALKVVQHAPCTVVSVR